MTFRENANIGGGRATRGGGGGGGLAVGGGIGTILLALVIMLFGGDPGAILGGGQPQSSPEQNVELAECKTGADANANVDCRMKGGMASLEQYWTKTYPKAPAANAVIFNGAVNTACGQATSQVGPFYCPLDKIIYLDTAFFDQLKGQLGAEGGNLGELYVIGHEYGHHIQNYTRALEWSQKDPKGADSGAVRVELQADCFAGAWIANASKDQGLLEPPTKEDISSALSAAEAVGDDSIQERMQGQVTKHNWTHGSSEERMGWFMTGYNSGDPNSCDVLNKGAEGYAR